MNKPTRVPSPMRQHFGVFATVLDAHAHGGLVTQVSLDVVRKWVNDGLAMRDGLEGADGLEAVGAGPKPPAYNLSSSQADFAANTARAEAAIAGRTWPEDS